MLTNKLRICKLRKREKLCGTCGLNERKAMQQPDIQFLPVRPGLFGCFGWLRQADEEAQEYLLNYPT